MENTQSFSYVDDRNNDRTISIRPDDLKFVQKDAVITDEVLKTKPTTFFKDALKRFSKNKSSVVAAVILGLLLLLSVVLPFAIPYDIQKQKNNEMYLEPKLFEAGTGWWDGTRQYSMIVYDKSTEEPDPETFIASAVSKLSASKEGDYFADKTSKYAYGGYVRFWMDKAEATDFSSYGQYYSYPYDFNTDSGKYTLTYEVGELPEGSFSTQGEYAVYFRYNEYLGSNSFATDPTYVKIKDFSTATGTQTIDFNAALTAAGAPSKYYDGSQAVISFVLKPAADNFTSVLLKNVVVSSTNTSEAETLAKVSYTDANANLLNIKQDTSGNAGDHYWTSLYSHVTLYHANIQYCSFTYDTYEAHYGLREGNKFSSTEIADWISKGYMKLELDKYLALTTRTPDDLKALQDSFEILDDSRCPIRSVDSVKVLNIPGVTGVYNVYGTVSLYRYYGYSSMPKFLFGTGKPGSDMVKLTFTGLLYSLILGVITSLICFVFGLIWGAISGYFGGLTDIVMERITDILSGMPWIVIMTLIIVHLGRTMTTFGIALCVDGWIGTAAITRTQFYRFKRSRIHLGGPYFGCLR
jgi:ABC-type dipeptide/oligopeptide/nickel transport system permease subunit